ncbi:unnamed protein product [Sphagnum troendelagicum]|uniref:Uncharacterized protein n=1 Tax=Sphagnum troendelagicum TaxID=128251 RepID=A0ABP0USF5_9BRYO
MKTNKILAMQITEHDEPPRKYFRDFKWMIIRVSYLSFTSTLIHITSRTQWFSDIFLMSLKFR